jgi:hypothetical protein
MSAASNSEFSRMRTVNEFVALYRKFGVKFGTMDLKITPALKSTQDDEIGWNEVEIMVETCGFEVKTVDVYRNDEMLTSWFVIRLVAKADS